MSTHPTQHEPEQFTPHFAVLAFLIPGLGHAARGERWRGIAIFAGVMWLFVWGLLVGGIDVVDHRDNRWWFLGQAGVGAPALAVDLVHQRVFKRLDPVSGKLAKITPAEARARSRDPNARPPLAEALAHPEEIGSLFGAIAGMLNLLCVVDAAWRTPRRRRREDAPATAAIGADSIGAAP